VSSKIIIKCFLVFIEIKDDLLDIMLPRHSFQRISSVQIKCN